MRKPILLLLTIFVLIPMNMWADDYTKLWQKVEEAKEKDLPKTMIEQLQVIINKATKEKEFGQLMKAELTTIQAQSEISSDSVAPAVQRLVQKELNMRGKDEVCAAVYQSILGTIFSTYSPLDEHSDSISRDYFRRSLSNPSLLARHKAKEYDPIMTKKGDDSKWFNHDLLSVLAMAANDFQGMSDYYTQNGNREAACLAQLMQVRKDREETRYPYDEDMFISRLDELTKTYGDLEVAGEIAVMRNQLMGSERAKTRYEYLNDALAKWGSWPRTNELRNTLKAMTTPKYSMYIRSQVISPSEETSIELHSIRNINQIRVEITRLNTDVAKMRGHADYNSLVKMKTGSPVFTQTQTFTGKEVYEYYDAKYDIPKLPVGVYLVEINTENDDLTVGWLALYVTDVFVLAQQLPEHKIRYVVVNATTGHPIPNAQLRLEFEDEKDRKKTFFREYSCDGKGEYIYQMEKRKYGYDSPEMVYAYTESDRFSPDASMRTSYSYSPNSSFDEIDNLYTDRSIYRPGQTVNVAVVSYQNIDSWETHVSSDKTLTLKLRDANYQVVETKTVTTDEWGKASTTFTLPKSGLTGHFSIVSNDGSVSFRVEEYKRPTFEVEFLPVEQQYQNGDTLKVKGHAQTYAGVPVQGAKVDYQVMRKYASWWWGYRYGGEETQMATGSTTTDDNGDFFVDMPMKLPDYFDGDCVFYHFTTKATVVDQAGETHEGMITLPLGNKATALSCNIPEKALKDSVKTVVFSRYNAAGVTIDGDVTFTIDEGETIHAKANQPFSIVDVLKKLESGEHVLKANCGDNELKQKFVVFSLNDKTPYENMHSWWYVTETTFPRDGKPIYLQYGTSDHDVYAVYTVFSGDNILEQGAVKMDNELRLKTIKYKKEWGSGIRITMAWVKEGKAYTHSTALARPLPDKRLIVKWKTFRDKLKPGQQETWTLHVETPDGKPAVAQLMATMYDHSLDQLYPHNWWLTIRLSQALPSASWAATAHSSESLSREMRYKRLKVEELSFTMLNDELMSFAGPYYRLGGGARFRGGNAKMMSLKAGLVEVMAYDAAPMALAESNAVAEKESVAEEKQPEAEQNTGQDGSLRENFNETAMFMPAIHVDKNGNASFTFTLPESVTTWKFQGIAHDKELNHGSISGLSVAQKEVMVQPHLPRFLRMGDKAHLRTKIFNTAEKDVKGQVTMTIINPENDEVITKITKPFQVAQGQTTMADFEFSPSQQYDMLVCRIMAEGDGFSDGEQHYLPVLTNREWVTNTYPFTQHNLGQLKVALDQLFETRDGSRLTIEYTNNPAWLMIQALPAMAARVYDNAIDQAMAFYANSIASYILKQHPDVQKTIEAWMKEEGEETSTMSNLQKNQELKNLTLGDTPWVSRAKHEQEQKSQLINYFNRMEVENRIDENLKKLNKLQRSDGSWSWWEGMEGSPFMTIAVSEMMVKLNHMIGKQQRTENMLEKALSFLDGFLYEEMEEMKKLEKEGFKDLRPSESVVNVLYIYALRERKISGKTQEAVDYMIERLLKYNKQLSIYGKATSAIILNYYGKQDKAAEYLQSIREYTVYKEEMGRYFDTWKANYSWRNYRIPSQVAAIEAIKMLEPQDQQTVNEMRRWLLQSKRTQLWDTPINSVDAVYAFLDGNMTTLDTSTPATMAIDGKALPLDEGSKGLGYVKMVREDEKGHELVIDKTAEGTSWGAIYAQFMQETTKVSSMAEGLKVSREIRSESTQLKVGDKVTIRITIVADRDYDFVQVSDKRAACLQPTNQLSGYRNGCYVAPKDQETNYFFNKMHKGTHMVETTYYVERPGDYTTGTCTATCAYSPEYSGRDKALLLKVAE